MMVLKGPRFFATTGFVVVALLLVPGAGPVSAAAPGNDDRGQATPVGALPFRDNLETSEATPQGSDPECASDPESNPTVWYSFTPSVTGRYIASTRGSDYDTMLWVGTAGVDLHEIDCNDDHANLQSMVSWRARAGVEYLIMVGSCCGGDGGQLAFHIKRAPPPPSLSLTLDRARLTRNGKVELSGELRCSQVRVVAHLDARVQQAFGRRIIKGQRSKSVACGSDWFIQVGNRYLGFSRSQARVSITATACNVSGCHRERVTRTVRVR